MSSCVYGQRVRHTRSAAKNFGRSAPRNGPRGDVSQRRHRRDHAKVKTMAQLVERTARLEISPPAAAPSVTPEAAAEAAPSITLDAAAIAQAIQATGYCVVDDALGAMHAEQLGAACRAKKAPATIQEGTDRINDSKRRDDSVAFLKD